VQRRGPSELVIRPQEDRDAAAATALRREADDAEVATEEGWLHRRHRIQPRHGFLGLAAELGEQVVAIGQAGLNVETTTPGASWASVQVTAAHRRQGIGSSLHDALLDHLREIGAKEVTAFTRRTEEGERWAEARGWKRLLTGPLIALDPRDVPEPTPPPGFECLSMAAFNRPEAIFEVTRVVLVDEPNPVPADDLRYEDWLDEWGHPDLDRDASTVVVREELAVAFAYVKISGTRAQHAGTGTLAEFRGRGIASAAKRHALRAAAAKGVTRITTTNAEENAAMRAINRRLGFEPVGEHAIFGRPVELS
jgi:RimJ/RimL family protein N-acetyltransferase